MASDQNVLSWTPANWITVLIMVALGFTILGAAARIWQNRKAAMAAA
jgi:hypothetical protein